MKKNLFFGLSSAAVALSLLTTSCASDDFSIGSSTGKIAPTLGVDGQTVTSQPKGRAAASLSVDELSLRLTSADGSTAKEWASVSDFDNKVEYRVGTYTMEAYYGALETEGFDSPYYHGATTFEVEENRTTPVAITAKLANSMVHIECTDALKSYFASYGIKLRSEGGEYIPLSNDETRPVYLRPGKVSITADIVKQNGVAATLEAAVFTAKPQYEYTVTIDVNNGNVGDAQLVITYDENVEEEDVVVELKDDLLNAPAPEIAVTGFDPEQHYTLISGMASPVSPKYNIVARGGISAVTLTTDSKSLIEQGWPAEINLCSATPNQQAQLQALGLQARGLFGNVDKLAILDLTDVISHISYRQAGSNETKITVTVKDKIGKVTEPVTLNLTVEPIEVELTANEPLFMDVETVGVSFNYNGDNVSENVSFEFKNKRGVWENAEVVSISAAARSSQTYHAVVKVAAEYNPVVLRIKCLDTYSDPMTINRVEPDFTITSVPGDVFATYAYFDVFDKAGNPAVLPSEAKFKLAADGAAYADKPFVVEGNSIKVTGLTGGKSYNAKIEVYGVPAPEISFETESAIQLPNSDMETWNVTASESNWDRWDVNGWATFNAMTTMTSGTRHNTAYVSRSGTARAGSPHAGTYCAELRTIGWGAGNSAVGSISSDNPKYINKGMMYLGVGPTSYSNADSEIVKGVDFASRPSSVSFWYKFSAKNSADYTGAQVWVKDAKGNIIASGIVTNLNSTDWTQITIPLSYTRKAEKAASVFVEFVSSDSPSYATRSKDWFTVPSFGNLSDGKFQGSSTFIDDITLNY